MGGEVTGGGRGQPAGMGSSCVTRCQKSEPRHREDSARGGQLGTLPVPYLQWSWNAPEYTESIKSVPFYRKQLDTNLSVNRGTVSHFSPRPDLRQLPDAGSTEGAVRHRLMAHVQNHIRMHTPITCTCVRIHTKSHIPVVHIHPCTHTIAYAHTRQSHVCT